MSNIMVSNSTYQAGTLDTASTLVDNVSPMTVSQPNGLASAIIQIETILGSGPDLKGSMADLATRLNVQMTAAGILLPPGVILPYGGSSAPNSLFLMAQGGTANRTTDAPLFAVYSTTFGVGDGSTTFGLPDLRSRALIGAGSQTYVASFAPADVNTGTEVITVPANMTLYTGDAVVLTTTDTVPAGLVASTTYYVIRVTSTTLKLASSLANAMAGTAIDITSQGVGTHSLTITLPSRTLGAVGGQWEHFQDMTEAARHNHGVTDPGHSHGIQLKNTSGGATTGDILDSSSLTTNATVGTTASNTTGLTVNFTTTPVAMNLMNPWLALNFIIKR